MSLGVFDYFVGSQVFKTFNICVYVCMFPCTLCFVIFCMFCMYIIYIRTCIYLSICIFVCAYIHVYFTCVYICMCVYICIFICASLCLCVGTHFCLYKSYLFNCLSCGYLGCYLSVWHCCLGSTLGFSFKIVKLNTTTGTKSSTRVIKINLGNMNSLFPTIIVNNFGCMYLFIQIKFQLID